MNQTISSKLTFDKKLSMQQIMDLFEISKNYEGSIYFVCKNRVVEPERLSKLVSFMLTLEDCSDLKIMIEGPEVQAIMQKINECCAGSYISEDKMDFVVHSNHKIKL